MVILHTQCLTFNKYKSNFMQDVITNLNKQVENCVFSDWLWKLMMLWSVFECPRTKRNSNEKFISDFAAVHRSGFYTYSSHLRGPVSTPLPLQLFHHTSARWCYASAPDPKKCTSTQSFSKRNSTPRGGSINISISSHSLPWVEFLTWESPSPFPPYHHFDWLVAQVLQPSQHESSQD